MAAEAYATAAGYYGPFAVNLRFFAAGIGLTVAFASGASGKCTVMVSGESTYNPGVAGNQYPFFVNHPVLQNLASDATDSLAYPVQWVLLNVTQVTPNSQGQGIHFGLIDVMAYPPGAL